MYDEFHNWIPARVALEEAPEEKGAYCFGVQEGAEILYLGRARMGSARGPKGIKGRITRHVKGSTNGNQALWRHIARSRGSVQVAWLTEPDQREIFARHRIRTAQSFEVWALKAYFADHGELPRFNSRGAMEVEKLADLYDRLTGQGRR